MGVQTGLAGASLSDLTGGHVTFPVKNLELAFLKHLGSFLPLQRAPPGVGGHRQAWGGLRLPLSSGFLCGGALAMQNGAAPAKRQKLQTLEVCFIPGFLGQLPQWPLVCKLLWL